MARTVLERYKLLIRILRLCSALCGADVLDPEYKVNLLTWIVIAFINLFYIFTGYTIYVNLYVEGEWTNVLQALCMVGSAVQGFCKLLNAIWNKKYLIELLSTLEAIYEEYDRKHVEYRKCLNKSINTVDKCIKSMAVVYAGLLVGVIGVMPFFRLFYNRRVFVMQFLLPGIDPNTNHGFIIMNFMHCCCIFFGAFGNFAADSCFFTLVSHVPLFKDILLCKFHDLNVKLKADDDDDGDGDENEGHQNCRELLKDILQWHQHYMRYISTVKENYFWVIMVQFATMTLSLACTLFCLILGKWPGGQTYLAYCFIMLHVYCCLGTMIEISNDGFIDSCYTEVIWYRLPVAERKMLLMMLMMSQNAGGLTIGAVIPLTMNTGLQLTKMIYTMTMMLINFLN
ncbi:odorant receptor 67d-like [Musca vetustissima]|uniref:odorant receptor 67d-like n=1 Tax=Musca vetustissima TaxID=27455 RepID=UPI002AB6892D|nr:odorant receptor 67d-like [Musca vetustissima]